MIKVFASFQISLAPRREWIPILLGIHAITAEVHTSGGEVSCSTEPYPKSPAHKQSKWVVILSHQVWKCLFHSNGYFEWFLIISLPAVWRWPTREQGHVENSHRARTLL